jgi:hypothetical protein
MIEHRSLVQEYKKSDNQITQFLINNYKKILPKFANLKLSVDEVDQIAWFYSMCYNGWYEKKEGKNYANHKINILVQFLSNLKGANNAYKDEINSYIKRFENKLKEQRFRNTENKLNERVHSYYNVSNDQKIATKRQLKKLERSLKEISNFFDNQSCNFQLICSRIPLERVDEIISMLTSTIRRLRDEYELLIPYEGLNLNEKDVYAHWENSEYFKVGYIYIATNKFMPSLVKVGETKRWPTVRLNGLSKPTGVPGEFKLEYARTSVINLKINQTNRQIEKTIHNGFYNKLVDDGYFEKENDELQKSEFFMVPSVAYAMSFVDDYLDGMDRLLFHSEYFNKK